MIWPSKHGLPNNNHTIIKHHGLPRPSTASPFRSVPPPCRRPVPAPHELADRPTSGCQRSQWSPVPWKAPSLEVMLGMYQLYTHGYIPVIYLSYMGIWCYMSVIDHITNFWQNWEWFRWQNWERRWFPGDHIIINYQMLIYIIMYCNVNYRPTLNVDGSTESILQYPPNLDTVDICGSCVLKNHHSSTISWNFVRNLLFYFLWLT